MICGVFVYDFGFFRVSKNKHGRLIGTAKNKAVGEGRVKLSDKIMTTEQAALTEKHHGRKTVVFCFSYIQNHDREIKDYTDNPRGRRKSIVSHINLSGKRKSLVCLYK